VVDVDGLRLLRDDDRLLRRAGTPFVAEPASALRRQRLRLHKSEQVLVVSELAGVQRVMVMSISVGS
jgi:hypothetical protein